MKEKGGMSAGFKAREDPLFVGIRLTEPVPGVQLDPDANKEKKEKDTDKAGEENPNEEKKDNKAERETPNKEQKENNAGEEGGRNECESSVLVERLDKMLEKLEEEGNEEGTKG